MAHTQEDNQATETACERDQMSDLFETDFNVVIIDMFTEIKETMIKEAKEGVMIMLHQKRISIKRLKLEKEIKWRLWN